MLKSKCILSVVLKGFAGCSLAGIVAVTVEVNDFVLPTGGGDQGKPTHCFVKQGVYKTVLAESPAASQNFINKLSWLKIIIHKLSIINQINYLCADF